MTDVIKQFFNYIQYERRLSPNTILAYQIDLKQLKEFLEKDFQIFDFLSVKPNHLRAWMISLIEQKDLSSTVNRKISCIKSLYKFLLKHNYITVNPSTKLIRPKIPKRLPKDVAAPKLANLKDFLELNTQSNEFSAMRDYVMFMTFYLCGLRRNELIELQWNQVDIAQKQIRVLGKGKKERVIPVRSEWIDLLLRYKNNLEQHLENREENYIFVLDNGKMMYPNFVYRKIQNYLSMVTTQEGVGPHALRHSFATHLLNEGAELNAIKELLGHSSLAATQVYTHNSIEKLRQIHKFSHPKP